MRIDTEVMRILKGGGTEVRKNEKGTLYYDVHANDGTTFPKGTEVTFEGSQEELMQAYMGGVVPVVLPNGELRDLEPGCRRLV